MFELKTIRLTKKGSTKKQLILLFHLNSYCPCLYPLLFSMKVLRFQRALLHKDLKCKAPLIEPNLRRNLGKWST
ncbi:hypothetical protein C3420_16920 [Acinetobacter sp. ACNIH3]|jgi:hypothetical protein|uniref:Uncharacterized protein n=1 Tax=Acinetobacter pseudolwoffii TaxID=2053287 RepID=A0A2H9UI08_9GAMM|nr:hypothetical protein CU320_14640 [Acinetobacter pseudolwoffii]POU10765.1 hypothetical protein C3420_16920 [Acinetobacter sp. ACNIH3]POV71717.1 hypothetical protein C3421_16745 [Acinetobacter sp. ACNIH4]